MEVESRSGKVTVAQTYYNVYQRTAFLQEGKKVSYNACMLLVGPIN